ncbi:MAG: DNA cytosine methyltransferase [Hyphomicrobiales bacterium]
MNALTLFPTIPVRKQTYLPELIVDSFAGGGGASTGIEMALGRSPDYAINHDAEAIAMHAANHPDTVHLSKNIWQVDPIEVVGKSPVGLLWASPDCKHFSKAKGGKPLKRNIRDLGWSIVLWARRVRPRVIILENVEEFQTWGPLTIDDKPCPERKGQTFQKWVSEFKRLGYKIEWKELRACDYGAPTIRKRLFVIARRDGCPIVWPKPTHGKADDPDVISGAKKPYLTAGSDVVDFSHPCPSIFDTAKDIKEKLGLRAQRPLAEATMARIARGVKRYVLECAQPFIVTCNHSGKNQRGWGMDEPVRTMTASRDAHGLVLPYVSYAQHGGSNRSAGDPMHTITASKKDQNAVVAAFLAKHNTGATGSSMNEPAHTITGNGSGKREGGATPMAVVAANMLTLRGSARRDAAMTQPLNTISSGGTHNAVIASHISRQFGQGTGSSMEDPIGTITAGGAEKAAIVAAFMQKYYGTDQAPELSDPMHTDTTRDRFSLVKVEIDGQTFVIEDIGMRMLTPRERFRAQGFPDSYEIENGEDENGQEIKFSQAAQGRMCGNSVCPPLARALVAANVPELAVVSVAA